MILQILLTVPVVQAVDTPVFTIEEDNGRPGFLNQKGPAGKEGLLPGIFEDEGFRGVAAVAQG